MRNREEICRIATATSTKEYRHVIALSYLIERTDPPNSWIEFSRSRCSAGAQLLNVPLINRIYSSTSTRSISSESRRQPRKSFANHHLGPGMISYLDAVWLEHDLKCSQEYICSATTKKLKEEEGFLKSFPSSSISL